MPDEDYGDATPSQASLDAQTQGQQVLAEAGRQGRIDLARQQVLEAVQGGANSAAGRTLLGRLDSLAENQEYEDPNEVYAEFTKFIHQRPAPASQPAAPVKQAAPAGTRQAAPRPSTPASRAKDNQRLLDPDTPHDELVAIRAKQKAAGEW